MANRLVTFLLIAALGIILGGAVVQFGYTPIYNSFSSDEARKSVEVTEEQLQELKRATLLRDVICFGFWGAIVGVVSAVGSGIRRIPRPNMTAIAAGLVLGGLFGAFSGWFGHWFVRNVQLQMDPMAYGALRWFSTLSPVAVAAAVAAALSVRIQTDLAQALVGALLGTLVAGALYSVLTGLVSNNESWDVVLPAFSLNRWLLTGLALLCIGLGIVSQVGRDKKNLPASDKLVEGES